MIPRHGPAATSPNVTPHELRVEAHTMEGSVWRELVNV